MKTTLVPFNFMQNTNLFPLFNGPIRWYSEYPQKFENPTKKCHKETRRRDIEKRRSALNFQAKMIL